MYKRINFSKYGLLGHLSLVIVLAVHIASGDYLLFHSDLYSLSLYLGVMTIIVMAILHLISALIKLISPHNAWKENIYKVAVGNITMFWGLVVFFQINTIIPGHVFLIITSVFLAIWLQIKGILFKNIFRAIIAFSYLTTAHLLFPILPTLLLIIAILPFIFIVNIVIPFVIIPDSSYHLIKQKIERLGIVLLCTLPLVPIFLGINHAMIRGQKTNITQDKHLVMIVLDALPTELIHSYNPKETPTAFDDILSNSLRYSNMYTQSPYTYGFFGTFYNGKPCSLEVSCTVKTNLLGTLDKHDILVQRMSFHKLGTPEGSAIHSNDYHGLKSYFLTENNNTFPKLLGLKYHINLSNIGMNPVFKTYLGRILYSTFNVTDYYHPKRGTHIPNIDFYIDQLSYNQTNNDQSFTIIHTRWNQFIAKDWTKYSISPQNAVDFRSTTVDHQYEDHQSPFVERFRAEAKQHMVTLAEQLQQFVNKVDSRFKQKKPTIIIVADHGAMTSKNRFDYQWHPQEGAIHTILAVINGDKIGKDERYFTTADLNISVLDFFNIRPTNKTVSIFNKKGRNDYVATVTQRSDLNKEWFLVISGMQEKYQINLHPQGSGDIKFITINGFDESSFTQIDKIPHKINEHVSSELNLLDTKDIHHKFKILLPNLK